MSATGRFRSFGAKVTASVTLTTGLAVLLVCAILVAADYVESRREAIAIARSEANIIAINSEAPLSFDDPQMGTEVLAALKVVPNVASAQLYRPDGTVFVKYLNPALAAPDMMLLAQGVRDVGDWLWVTEPIQLPTGELGHLQVAFDMSGQRRRAWATMGIALAVAASTTLIAFFVAGRIRRILAKPVAELASTAQRVSDTKDYSLRAAKYSDDELGQLTDVINRMLSQIERQSAEIEARQKQFRLAVEAAPNAMVMVDDRGTILLINTEAERLFGYGRDELIGQSVDVLVPERFRSKHPRYREGFFHDPNARPMGAGRDLFGRHKDGGEVPVEIGLNPIQTDDGLRVLASIVDITERKRTEAERLELLNSERAARTEAERASRMKDEFVATLSHELRTPLSAILGWAQMLRAGGGASPQEVAKGLEIIDRNARVQTRIIEDLLDMSRIISGKIRLDVQQVNLADVIEAALGTVRPAAEAKGIRLQAIIDPHVGPLRGDASRLQQIVWNLLSNAIKFTGRDGRVQVALERVNSHVEINVSDTGEGFKPDFAPFLFERFRQADSTTTRRHSGLGLGLAIVRQLVELHGGTVTAHSPGEGKGATFVVKLPLMVVHTTADAGARVHPRVPSPPSRDMAQPSLTGLKALVVDDEADARDLVGRLLEQHDVRVASAGSAAEALELFRSFHPDVLISDIGMPEVDGYELIRRVRAMEAGARRSTPALALTAFARSEDRTRALLAGYQMHLAKPVEPAELIATIASLAGKMARQN